MKRWIIAVVAVLLMVPGSGFAQEKCFKVVNRTPGEIKAFSKSGQKIYGFAGPYSVEKMCCNQLYEKPCFEKNDGTAKIKIVRMVPGSPDEFSGPTCYKLYVKPGQIISVSLDMDGSHIVCKRIESEKDIKPLPKFEDLDQNGDGKIDRQEAGKNPMLSYEFGSTDIDSDKIVDKQEYNSFLQKVNVFRGVNF